MSAEKPKALSLPPAAPRPTVAGRPVMTQTLVGHTAPAPPEVTAWLNALLRLDGKPATPLGEALNVAHSSPTVPAFPAVVDVPELPESALELVPEPPAPPPPPVAEAPPPVVEAAPPPPAVAEVAAPPPIAEVPLALPPPVAAAEPPPPIAPRMTPAVPVENLDADVDTAIVTSGGGRRRLVALALIGALGLAAALVVRGRHATAPPTAAAPAEIVAQPPEIVAPPVAPTPAPSPHLELGLDPAGAAPPPLAAAATPPSEEATAQPQLQPAEEAPKQPRRERTSSEAAGDGTALQRGNTLLKGGNASGAAAAFEEAVRLSPDEPGGYRGLGLAYEQLGKSAEAMDAFKRYLKLATRSRDREWAARHLYELAHPAE